MKFPLSLILLLVSTFSWAQNTSTLALPGANSSLAIPNMAAHGGVLYVAYRSFDRLQNSKKLEVIAYDLKSRKELHHVKLLVPKVHGARASDGLFISEDGQTLAYAELGDPSLILVLSAKDLGEIRRTNVLPYTSQDHQRMFAGFDGDHLCIASNVFEYGKPQLEGLRFIRLRLSDLKPSSDTKIQGVTQENPGSIVWLPREKSTWVVRGHLWNQHTEAGQLTGQALKGENAVSKGAIPLGGTRLLAFYGRYEDGTIIGYADGQERELKLKCVPHPYGKSTDPMYAGAICTTQSDELPEHGGDKVRTSEFLLLKTDGPSIVWKHPMNFLAVTDGDEMRSGIQAECPLVYRDGSRLLIVAPTTKPELVVYDLPLEPGA